MRIHRVEKLHGDFERLHENLASELIILPNFPEGGGIASLVGKSWWVGGSVGMGKIVDTAEGPAPNVNPKHLRC